MKLEINNNRKGGKSTNMQKLDNILRTTNGSKKKSKRKSKKSLKTNENRKKYQNLWMLQNNSERKVIVINAYIKTIDQQQPNFTLQ